MTDVSNYSLEQIAQILKDKKEKEDRDKKDKEDAERKEKKDKEDAEKKDKKKLETKEKVKEVTQMIRDICSRIITKEEISITLSGLPVCKKSLNYSAIEKIETALDIAWEESDFQLKREHLAVSMNNALAEIRKGKRKIIIDKLKFDPALEQYADDSITRIVKHFRDEDPNKSVSSEELDILAFKQFFYQVKAKLINENLLIKNPIALVFYGAQKIGKSWLVDNISSIVKELYISATPAELSKGNYEKNIPSLASNYMVYFDDLTKLEENEVGNFKSFITNQEVFYRQFGTQRRAQKFNVSTVIASTNLPLSDIVHDDTGNRRFYQFTMKQLLPHNLEEFYSEITDLDFLSIWRGIDENVAPLNEKLFEEVQKYQKIWGTKSTLHQFLYDNPDLFLKDTEVQELPKDKYIDIDLNKVQRLIMMYSTYYGINLKFISNSRILDVFKGQEIKIEGLSGKQLRYSAIRFYVDKALFDAAKIKYIPNSKSSREV